MNFAKNVFSYITEMNCDSKKFIGNNVACQPLKQNYRQTRQNEQKEISNRKSGRQAHWMRLCGAASRLAETRKSTSVTDRRTDGLTDKVPSTVAWHTTKKTTFLAKQTVFLFRQKLMQKLGNWKCVKLVNGVKTSPYPDLYPTLLLMNGKKLRLRANLGLAFPAGIQKRAAPDEARDEGGGGLLEWLLGG